MGKNKKEILSLHFKGVKKVYQIKLVYWYLYYNTATASMVEKATGVHQKNICRFKAELEKKGVLWVVEQKKCLCTGNFAWYLSTNPDIPPFKSNQLSLFQ